VALLELDRVEGRYGDSLAVRDIAFHLDEGQSLALLGRNGAGKSTILRLIAGSLTPAAGEVRWDGTVLGAAPPEARVRKGIVLVPEGRGIFPGLTTDENLRGGAYWDRPSRADYHERLDRVFDLIPRLAELRPRLGGSLSGGEQQMLAIGRALMSSPRLLLLDEPSLGLAPKVVEALYDVFHRLARSSIALVIVEQYVGLALQLCDAVIGLDKGTVVYTGPASEFGRDGAIQDLYMAGSLSAAGS